MHASGGGTETKMRWTERLGNGFEPVVGSTGEQFERCLTMALEVEVLAELALALAARVVGDRDRIAPRIWILSLDRRALDVEAVARRGHKTTAAAHRSPDGLDAASLPRIARRGWVEVVEHALVGARGIGHPLGGEAISGTAPRQRHAVYLHDSLSVCLGKARASPLAGAHVVGRLGCAATCLHNLY